MAPCNPVISKMVVTVTQVTAPLISTPASLFFPFNVILSSTFVNFMRWCGKDDHAVSCSGEKKHPRIIWSQLPVEINHLLLNQPAWLLKPSANAMPQTPCATLLKSSSSEMRTKHGWKQFYGHRERWAWCLLKFTIDLEKQIQSGTKLTVTESTVARK